MRRAAQRVLAPIVVSPARAARRARAAGAAIITIAVVEEGRRGALRGGRFLCFLRLALRGLGRRGWWCFLFALAFGGVKDAHLDL